MVLNRFLEAMGKSWRSLDEIPKELFTPDAAASLFKPHNPDLNFADISLAIRAAKQVDGRNLFDVAGLEKSEENVMALLGNYYRIQIKNSIPSAIDSTLRPTRTEMTRWDSFSLRSAEYDLLLLLNGNNVSETASMQNPHSLSRHLVRTAYLARIMMTECLRGQGIRRDSGAGKLTGFGFSHLGGLHPYHIVVPATIHDEPRNFTHSSAHDTLVHGLADDIGLLPTIVKAIHEPVPVDADVDPARYDHSGAQRILRLADNFGKVVEQKDGRLRLRTTVDEVCGHSRSRQNHYFELEHETPGTFWYGLTKEVHLQKYLENERLMYEAAVKWFEKISRRGFEDLLESINSSPEDYKIIDF